MSISLNKGSSLSLAKSDGSALSHVRLGLGWDAAPAPAKKGLFGGLAKALGGSVDLDASAILFDSSGQVVDKVSFSHLRSNDGSVTHSGDNLTGAGDGDDEQIVVNLTQVPANVNSVVFVITSYSGQKFDTLQNVFARVVDISNGEQEVVRYNLAESKNNTANVIAKISRSGNGWSFTAIGEYTDGRTVKNVVDVARNFA